jgi:hypothetical protein
LMFNVLTFVICPKSIKVICSGIIFCLEGELVASIISPPSRQNIIPEQITLILLRHYTNIITLKIKLGPENF